MATYVNFFKGAHADLPTSNYQPGAFYLTTDTSRLYFADSASKLLDLNKYVLFVENITALPTSGMKDGDIYYCKQENVLATHIAGVGWQQINRNTDTDTKPTGWTQSVTSDTTNGISVTLTLKTRIWDEQTGAWKNGSDEEYPVTFNISKEDIYDAIPEPQVDVTASVSGTNIVVTTKGDGSAGDGFTLKPGNGVLFDGTTDDITIHGKTYNITSPANTTEVQMADESSILAGRIYFEAGKQMTVSGVNANHIEYSHGTVVTDTTTASDDQVGFGAQIQFVKALGWDNGHLTDYDLGSLLMPAEPNYHVTTITSSTGADAGKLSVGIKDSQGSGNGNTLTSDKILYYKVGANADTTVYNTEALPVYTITEVDTKLNVLDAMHYMGTINGSDTNLPTTDVRNGDTYKNIVEGQEYTVNPTVATFVLADGTTASSITVEQGDLFIAMGKEENGFITGQIEWSYVPAGDDLDSKYEFSVSGNKVTLVNKSTPDDRPGDVTFAAGTDLSVETANAGKLGSTITYTHKSHAGTMSPANDFPSYGTTFTAISGLNLANGHVDGYTLTTYTLPQLNVSRLAVLNESNKPTIQLSDTFGNASTVKVDHDEYVIATPDATNGTITFSHSSHKGAKNTNPNTEPSWGGSFNALVDLTLANGHVDSYTVTPFILPQDPSINTINTSVTKDASGVVTVKETITQGNSSKGETKETSHSFSTSTASMSLTASGTNVAIDLVWGSF